MCLKAPSWRIAQYENDGRERIVSPALPCSIQDLLSTCLRRDRPASSVHSLLVLQQAHCLDTAVLHQKRTSFRNDLESHSDQVHVSLLLLGPRQQATRPLDRGCRRRALIRASWRDRELVNLTSVSNRQLITSPAASNSSLDR